MRVHGSCVELGNHILQRATILFFRMMSVLSTQLLCTSFLAPFF